MNPSYKLGKRYFLGGNRPISKNDFDNYLARRNIQGIGKQWYNQCKNWLLKYLEYVDWQIDENKTLAYFQQLKDYHPLTYYKKQIYQIRRFLEYLNVDWVSTIKLPPDPEYTPKRVTTEDIQKTLNYYEGHQYFKQIKAIVLLGSTSGMRAEELYQLKPEDIDLDNRTVKINHNPRSGQTTKTAKSRTSFFNEEAQRILKDYFEWFNNGSGFKNLFTQSHITRIFKKSDLKVKDLRKFFSQEWDRQGGPTSIKKLLMGHRKDVDLKHYNAQNEEDLRKIYDKVGFIAFNSRVFLTLILLRTAKIYLIFYQ